MTCRRCRRPSRIYGVAEIVEGRQAIFSRDEIARACRSWGRMLQVPDGVDGPKLLWALAGCESSFGVNCLPRHEPYYHNLAAAKTNAKLVALTAKWGCDAHSSFGPWQELLVNCSGEMRPEDFANLSRAGMEVAQFINAWVFNYRGATTLAQIAETYNSGKWQYLTVPPGVAKYAADCAKYYETPMPQADLLPQPYVAPQGEATSGYVALVDK